MTYDALKVELQNHNQDHVLAYFDTLPDDGKQQLLSQLSAVEWDQIDSWIDEYVVNKPDVDIPVDLSPAPYIPLIPENDEQAALLKSAEARGWELLKAGQVAAFTVAGGQGTRLGFDGPKGTFPVAPISGKTLFQWFAESLKRFSEIAGKVIPWYIMTSPMNDEPTRAFFKENAYFGLHAGDVMFFPQGTMPAFDYQGKLLLAGKDSLALSPDGHGGSLKALVKSGATADMAKHGIVHLNYFQVDNPLVSVINPTFIGIHDLKQADMSSRCLPKAEPFEKIGAFCMSEGKQMIVEYSDLPDELATQTDEQGRLRYRAGSPAIHVLRRDFIERLMESGSCKLPFHRAEKKIPFLDEAGNPVKPETPNGVKLEMFVFDALPMAKNPVILEACREDEFGPVKNKTGVDSVESSRQLMQERFAGWLKGRGVHVPRKADGTLDIALEINPASYVTEEDFQQADLSGYSFEAGSQVHIV